MATIKANLNFTPQIASDYILAYFRQKLIWGSLAYKGVRDFDKKQGETITFPYFAKMGAAQDAVEKTDLTIDSLIDESFTATVKEIGKAVDISASARIAGGFTPEQWNNEVLRQIGRLFAEKVDDDLLAEISKTGEHASVRSVNDVTLAAALGTDKGLSGLADQRCNIRNIQQDRVKAFGDRADEIVGVVMHSNHWLDIATDGTAGFLKADALDPFYNKKGFQGRDMNGAAWFVNDNVPSGEVTVTDNSSATQKYKTENVVYLKDKAFGFISKKDANVEQDRDILKRVDLFSGTFWYAVKSFHNKLTEGSQDDQRIAFAEYATDVQIA